MERDEKGRLKPILCPHGILGKSKCKECKKQQNKEWRDKNKDHVKEYNREYRRKHSQKYRELKKRWKQKNPERHSKHNLRHARKYPERMRIYSRIRYYPELYPLDSECVFCGATENLERGHLDYEDEGFNYLTVCHECNMWMTKNSGKRARENPFYIERISYTLFLVFTPLALPDSYTHKIIIIISGLSVLILGFITLWSYLANRRC